MKLVRGKWTKYSNKMFPQYVRKHWEIRVGKNKYVAFFNWERAMIFEQLIKHDVKRENGE